MRGFFEWMMMVIILGTTVLLILFPFACQKRKQPAAIALSPDEWKCSKFYSYTETFYKKSEGSASMPITETHNDCIQWNKKKWEEK